MQDDETPSGSGEGATSPTTPDDQPSAELSRAAREAVRQPPDPRLEKQFAYLGLWGEPEAATPGAGPSPGSAAPAESSRTDALLATLETRSVAVEARLDAVTRLLALVIRLLAVLIVIVLGLAIVVLAGSLA
jgi:hypothetical protein